MGGRNSKTILIICINFSHFTIIIIHLHLNPNQIFSFSIIHKTPSATPTSLKSSPLLQLQHLPLADHLRHQILPPLHHCHRLPHVICSQQSSALSSSFNIVVTPTRKEPRHISSTQISSSLLSFTRFAALSIYISPLLPSSSSPKPLSCSDPTPRRQSPDLQTLSPDLHRHHRRVTVVVATNSHRGRTEALTEIGEEEKPRAEEGRFIWVLLGLVLKPDPYPI